MFINQILENENRRKIYQIIESNPGIHLRALERRLDIPLSTIDYHLNYMVRRKIISREPSQNGDGRLTRYYTQPFDDHEKRILAALRQKRFREIVFYILQQQNAGFKTLHDQFPLPRSTLSFYLNYLVDHEILVRERVGYEYQYTVKDVDRVAKILIAYRSSFIDRVVDKAMNAWLDTNFRQK